MRIILVILMLSLAACSTGTGYPKAKAERTDRLAPIRVTPTAGTCLWQFSTRSETIDYAPIFGFSSEKAYIVLNGTRTELKRESASKGMVAGLPKMQIFTAENIAAKLILRREQSGAFKAALSLTKPSGWATMLPLEGTKVCR